MKDAVNKARKYRDELRSGYIPDLGFVESKDYLELLEFIELYGIQKERIIKDLKRQS